MKQPIPVFWGCTLTHNYPFIIESTIKALDIVGIEAHEVEGFGCCPDPVYVKSCGGELHLTLSARNLSLAEKEDKKLLVVCNGCYTVLSEANRELTNVKKRNMINEELPENRVYNGDVEVVHILGELHRKLPMIKTLIEKPLKGLRVGVHYGCHILYPPAVSGDLAENPRSMDEIVEATGAESIDYESKLDCCGTPVVTFDRDEADSMLKKKLMDMKDKVDCIVTTCPACFMRFDILPHELRGSGIPVLHLSELLCLALGIPSTELFLEGHTIKTSPVLEKLGIENREIELIRENLDLCEIKGHCMACSKECSAAEMTKGADREFNPLEIVEKLEAGRYYEVIRGREIWQCLQCGKCEESCPKNMGLKNLFIKLRKLSIKDGKMPRIIEDKIMMLKETGYGMPRRYGVRKRMGIEAAPEINAEDIRKIIENTTLEKNERDIH